MTAPRVGLLQFAMLASVLAAGVEPPSFITPPRRPPEPEPPRPLVVLHLPVPGLGARVLPST